MGERPIEGYEEIKREGEIEIERLRRMIII